jgi:hypothetical protein
VQLLLLSVVGSCGLVHGIPIGGVRECVVEGGTERPWWQPLRFEAEDTEWLECGQRGFVEGLLDQRSCFATAVVSDVSSLPFWSVEEDLFSP